MLSLYSESVYERDCCGFCCHWRQLIVLTLWQSAVLVLALNKQCPKIGLKVVKCFYFRDTPQSFEKI